MAVASWNQGHFKLLKFEGPNMAQHDFFYYFSLHPECFNCFPSMVINDVIMNIHCTKSNSA